MKPFVLVHCGFAGGWTWRQTAQCLRTAGHEVFAPTLTGLGERAHLATPQTSLDTHIDDLCGVVDCEDLTDVVLVASSSGSMAATGLLDRRPERVCRIVYLDTLVPEDGQSWMDLVGDRVAAPLLAAAERFGGGWRVPRSDVDPPRWVPQPLKSVTQQISLTNPAARHIPRAFIHCTSRPDDWFFGLGDVIDREAERVRSLGWDCRALAADHLPMLSAPLELSDLLQSMVPR